MTDDSPIKEGDCVLVLSLKKTGVVERLLRNGRIVVSLGKAQFTIEQSNYRRVQKKASSHQRSVPKGAFTTSRRRQSSRPVTLDLHGCTVADAREQVLAAIDKAIRNGSEYLSVVHGHGKGKLRELIYGEIAKVGVVAQVVPDPNNSGVARIHFLATHI